MRVWVWVRDRERERLTTLTGTTLLEARLDDAGLVVREQPPEEGGVLVR